MKRARVRARRRSSREIPSIKAQDDAFRAKRLTEIAQNHAEHGCRRLYSDYERDAIEGDEFMNTSDFGGFIALRDCRWVVDAGAAVQKSFAVVACVALRDRSRDGRWISPKIDFSMDVRSGA